MSDKVSETIMKMVTNLKPIPEQDLNQGMGRFSFGSTLKRPRSSLSFDSHNSSDTPKKTKFDIDLNLSYIGSPREIRRLRTDLVESRNTILNLENRIQQMHNVRQETHVMFDNERKLLKRQQENDRKTIESLEIQLQSIRQRELNLKMQLAEANSQHSMLKVRKDEEIEELEKSLSEMKEESHLFDGEESAEIVSLNRKIAELQIMLDGVEDDLEAQKALVFELEKRLSEKHEVEMELERKEHSLQVALLQIKNLEYAKENFMEYQEQAKAQTRKLTRYVELEKENEKLKEENSRYKDEIKNKLLLEEEVHHLKSRLVNFKEQEKKLLTLQAEQQQAEMYLNEWRSVARGICEITGSDSSLPHLLRSTVERLQQQEISLTADKMDLESQLSTSLYEFKMAKTELEKAQKLNAELRNTIELKQSLFHRMQKKIHLLSRERDNYRLQLDSYEKDLTITINPQSSSSHANQLQTQRDRIQALEKIVDGYRDLNTKLEMDLQVSNSSLSSDNSASKQEQILRSQELEQLKVENEMLKKKRDQLEIQLEYLSVGHDTLQGGQLYHLAENPLAQCLAQREQLVERLEQEVDKLKRKIKNLEDGIESSKLGESICPEDVKKLKEEVKNHEIKTQRLRDYFKSSLHEFRNVICMLLGYKIDRTSTSMYKLTSIYAENEEDQLCFQLGEDGNMSLLENNFSTTLEEMINLHLNHQKSIPVFLSALTMDLFTNSTISTKIFEIE